MKHIIVLGTSDIHGNIALSDSGGMDRLYTYVKMLREENENVILMDAGDSLVSNESAKVMQILKYDVCCVGNHEFDKGVEGFFNYAKDITFPILCGNVYSKDKKLLFDKAYTIIDVAGIKIGFIGITTPYLPIVSSYFESKSDEYIYESGTTSVGKIIDTLQVKTDVTVLLAHLDPYGEYDPENGTDAGISILKAFPQIDIAQFAHSHISETGCINGAMYAEVRDGARAVARFDLYFDEENKLINKTVNLIDLNAYEQSACFKDFAKEKGNTEKQSIIDEKRIKNTPLTEWVGRVLCNYAECEIAVVNYPYNIKLGKDDEISIDEIRKLFPFKNYIYRIKVSGAELKDYLRWSVKCFETAQSGISLKTDYPDYYQDVFYGIDYEIVLKENGEPQIRQLLVNGKEVRDDEQYSLAVNNYRYNINLKRLGIIEKQPEWKSEKTIDVIMHDCIKNGNNKLCNYKYSWKISV